MNQSLTTKRTITPEQLRDLKDKVQVEIERVTPLVKEYWDKGYRTVSTCLEVNLDKAEKAIRADDYKALKLSHSILKEYPLPIMAEPNKALGVVIIERTRQSGSPSPLGGGRHSQGAQRADEARKEAQP